MEQLIKKLLFALAAGLILIACSTTKYTYYFSKYSTNKSVKNKTNSFESIGAPVAVSDPPLTSIKREILMASTSNEPVELSSNESKPITNAGYQPLTKSVKIDTVKRQQEHKEKSINDDAKKSGNKSKNGFAVTGFILSILGLLFVDPIFALIALTGAILSAIGLKSEKPRLAKAGLVIGIIGAAIWVLLIIVFVGYGAGD